MYTSSRLRYFLKKWPGKKTLGVYRFLPLFFVVGAGLEWVMINAKVAPGGETFYDVYRRKQAESLAEAEDKARQEEQ
ncbi:ubiquinol-cytochrome c reductase complex assembly factor 5-like [Saccoglossus kowalevskii]